MRKKQRAERLAGIQSQEYMPMAEAVKNPTYSDNQVYMKLEMPSDTQPLQEMPLDRNSRQEIVAYEVPATPRLRRPGSTI